MLRTAWRAAMADLRQDVDRYVAFDGGTGTLAVLRAVLAHQGLQATALYRFGRFLKAAGLYGGSHPLGLLLTVLYAVLSRVNDAVNGIWISLDAQIGPGLFIAHYGGVIVGPATVGAHCNLGNDTTLGKGGRGEEQGLPVLGDRVLVSVGARVLGPVTLGDDVLIGANTVVTRDVPDRGVVVGNPGELVSTRGAFEYVRYPGDEADAARQASQELAAQS